MASLNQRRCNNILVLVMSSGNVTLHPFNSGAAAILRACPERAKRVERKTSLDISEIVRDFSTSVEMTEEVTDGEFESETNVATALCRRVLSRPDRAGRLQITDT